MYQVNPDDLDAITNYLAQLRRALCIQAAFGGTSADDLTEPAIRELLELAERLDETAASVGTPINQVLP